MHVRVVTIQERILISRTCINLASSVSAFQRDLPAHCFYSIILTALQSNWGKTRAGVEIFTVSGRRMLYAWVLCQGATFLATYDQNVA